MTCSLEIIQTLFHDFFPNPTTLIAKSLSSQLHDVPPPPSPLLSVQLSACGGWGSSPSHCYPHHGRTSAQCSLLPPLALSSILAHASFKKQLSSAASISISIHWIPAQNANLSVCNRQWVYRVESLNGNLLWRRRAIMLQAKQGSAEHSIARTSMLVVRTLQAWRRQRSLWFPVVRGRE